MEGETQEGNERDQLQGRKRLGPRIPNVVVPQTQAQGSQARGGPQRRQLPRPQVPQIIRPSSVDCMDIRGALRAQCNFFAIKHPQFA